MTAVKTTQTLAAFVGCALLAGCAAHTPALAPQTAGPRVAVPPPPPPGEPGDLAGLHSTELREIFGAPAFVRKEGPMEMWRYDGASCRAFFFLYPFADALLVRHVETVPRGREMAADESCLSSFHPRRAAPVS